MDLPGTEFLAATGADGRAQMSLPRAVDARSGRRPTLPPCRATSIALPRRCVRFGVAPGAQAGSERIKSRRQGDRGRTRRRRPACSPGLVAARDTRPSSGLVPCLVGRRGPPGGELCSLELRQRHPEAQYLYTHFSPSAEGLARRLPVDIADYLPYDLPGNHHTAAHRAPAPDLLVFAKLDLGRAGHPGRRRRRDRGAGGGNRPRRGADASAGPLGRLFAPATRRLRPPARSPTRTRPVWPGSGAQPADPAPRATRVSTACRRRSGRCRRRIRSLALGGGSHPGSGVHLAAGRGCGPSRLRCGHGRLSPRRG